MGRGRLRVYLGAAPGVGKTMAMLDEGHRRAGRGTDVVVGFAETHGRPRTAEKLQGLEIVPRKQMTYRGATFSEMDVDAVLARHPQVALVDELAHTNVPGSAREKRWQDVELLLEAGIDVISTVNIQHLESVNDVVEAITGIPQRETVPGFGRAGGGSGRTGRHDAGGAAPPDGARQHLRAGEGRRGPRQLLPHRQPDRAARARPALARRLGRRGIAALPRSSTASRGRGKPASGSSSRSPAARRARRCCAAARASPRGPPAVSCLPSTSPAATGWPARASRRWRRNGCSPNRSAASFHSVDRRRRTARAAGLRPGSQRDSDRARRAAGARRCGPRSPVPASGRLSPGCRARSTSTWSATTTSARAADCRSSAAA